MRGPTAVGRRDNTRGYEHIAIIRVILMAVEVIHPSVFCTTSPLRVVGYWSRSSYNSKFGGWVT